MYAEYNPFAPISVNLLSPAGGGAGGVPDFFTASTAPLSMKASFILIPPACSPFIAQRTKVATEKFSCFNLPIRSGYGYSGYKLVEIPIHVIPPP